MKNVQTQAEALVASEEHGRVRPCTSGDIIYRAFSRPYMDGPGQVINLFASCSYGTGQWKIFFEGMDGGEYQLLEQVPGVVNYLVTYYTASYTPGVGLANPVKTVTIRDAHGAHVVPVEPLA